MNRENTVRIVVTGTGVVGPLGCGTETVWSRLLAGKSGIRTLPVELTDGTGTSIGGQVPSLEEDPQAGYDPERVIAPKERKKMDRFIEFALIAAQEALTQAGWHPSEEAQQQRTATIIASGVGGFGAIAEAVRTTDTRGPRRLSPFTAPSFLANMAAGHVSITHGFKGPIGAPVTACAAGVQAIGDAARLIRSGEADIAVCGGTEAAYHLTAGPEDGNGAQRAMQQALRQADITAGDVQHINAHATSTPVGDKGELTAIRAVFGANSGVAITSTKSSTGHLLGAAGGIEAIFTILALRDQTIPPTLNLINPDKSADGLNLVGLSARKMPIKYALSNGFGFGGVNASVLFRRWEPH